MKPDPSGQGIARRLNDAITQLHEDVHRVEVWAGALSGFSQPVPEYKPSDDALLPAQEGEVVADVPPTKD